MGTYRTGIDLSSQNSNPQGKPCKSFVQVNPEKHLPCTLCSLSFQARLTFQPHVVQMSGQFAQVLLPGSQGRHEDEDLDENLPPEHSAQRLAPDLIRVSVTEPGAHSLHDD